MVITYSQLATFLSCRMKAKIRYEDELVSAKRTDALYFGTLVHSYLEGYYHAVKADKPYLHELGGYKDIEEGMLKAQALEAVKGYMARYPMGREQRDFSPMIVEGEFSLDIGDGVTLAGKIDLLVQSDDRYWLVDHKTSSQPIGDFVDTAAMSLQGHLYCLAAKAKGYDVAGMVYNVIQKPAFRPKAGETDAEFAERKATLKQPNRAKQQVADTVESWAEKCREFYADPASYARCHVTLNPRSVAMFKAEIEMAIEEYLRCQREGTWLRNTGACRQFFQKCQYFDYCSTASKPNEALNFGLEHKPAHEELGGQDAY
jgi:ATP-dependent exoDNAse (exonuclease V) beta subunit